MSELEELIVKILTDKKKGATAFRVNRKRIMSAIEQGHDPKLLFNDDNQGAWGFGPEALTLIADVLAIATATAEAVKWTRSQLKNHQERSNLLAWWKAELISHGVRREEAEEIANQFISDLTTVAERRGH